MTRALTIRLDDQLAERLRTAAFLRRRPAAEILRTALRDYLDELDDQPIDRTPTTAGLNYLRDRRQQHPRDQPTNQP